MSNNLREQILDLLADGQDHHYKAMALRLKVTPNLVAIMLFKLRQEGIVETPIVTLQIKKSKAGYYKLTAKAKKKGKK